MVILIDFLHILAGDSAINLSGRNIGMAQHLLHGAQICPAFQQMSGEGMPQGMRCDVLLDVGFTRMFLDYFPKALTGQPPAQTVQEQRRLLQIHPEQLVPHTGDITGHTVRSNRTNRHHSFLAGGPLQRANFSPVFTSSTFSEISSVTRIPVA